MKNTNCTMEKTLVLVTILFALCSCTKEIEFKGEQTDPKLVINSLVEPRQPVKAYVSKSNFFLDDNANMEAPEDVSVSLYVNDRLIGEMEPFVDTIWSPSYYWEDEHAYQLKKAFRHSYCPEVGDVVKITASANGFDEVEGTTSTLPEKAAWRITGMQLKETEKWPYFNEQDTDTVWHVDGTVEVTVEITDAHPGTIDCFRLRIDKDSHYFDGYDHQTYYYSAWPQYTDPIFDGLSPSSIDFVDYQLDEPNGTFVDQLFDGRSYSINLPIAFTYTAIEDMPSDFLRLEIYMEHLSKEYFNYLNTWKQGDEIDQFFAEPTQTYSNVKGGFGVVAGRTVDTLPVVLPVAE